MEGTVIPFYWIRIHGRRPCGQCGMSVKSFLIFRSGLILSPRQPWFRSTSRTTTRHYSPITVTPTFHKGSLSCFLLLFYGLLIIIAVSIIQFDALMSGNSFHCIVRDDRFDSILVLYTFLYIVDCAIGWHVLYL